MEQSTRKLGPWDFAPGSLESRAAARAMLEGAEEGRRRIEFISNIQRPGMDPSRIHAKPWQSWPDGTLMRIVYIPNREDWPPKDPAKVCWDCRCDRGPA